MAYSFDNTRVLLAPRIKCIETERCKSYPTPKLRRSRLKFRAMMKAVAEPEMMWLRPSECRYTREHTTNILPQVSTAESFATTALHESYDRLSLSTSQNRKFQIFFWIPIVLFLLVRPGSSLGVPSCLENPRRMEKEKAHHNLVCRIEPMQARQENGLVYVVKTPDQTRPDQSHKYTNQLSRNLVSFSV